VEGEASDGGYRVPPDAIRDIVESEPTPSLSLSPRRDAVLFLHRPSMPSVAHLARPDLRLAGLRVDPEVRSRSRMTSYTHMGVATLCTASDGVGDEVPLRGVPEGHGINFLAWAPDGAHVAFATIGVEAGAERSPFALHVASVESALGEGAQDGAPTFEARPLAAASRLNTVFDSFGWLGARTLLALTVPEGQADHPPARPEVPSGPKIQVSGAGEAAPVRTYQDLLSDEVDCDTLEYLTTSQLVKIDIHTGESAPFGEEGMITSFAPSPDGKFVLVARMERPFSYNVPCGRFPRTMEVLCASSGEVVHTLPRLELAEAIPIAHGAVREGPRSIEWRPDKDAELVWAECRDGGDPNVEVSPRDEVFSLDMHEVARSAAAPLEPRTLVQTDLRYGGIAWGGGGDLALVYESEWRSKRSVSWVLDPRTGEKRVLHDRDYEDRYTSPGSPMLRRTERGTYTLALVDGTHLLMSGAGASPEGDRPFLDLLNIESGETERLWRSEAPFFESVNSILSDAGDAPITRDNLRVLFSRESKTEPAQYSICSIGDGAARECIQITDFPHPYPSLKDYSKEILRYEREDGVTLTGTLYLPPGHDPARDGPLPTLLWAYPREYKSADAAAQMRGSPHTFSGIGNLSPLLFLSMGYAVLNGPSMPIIAKDGEDPETANDTYIEQLVSSAEAAVAELERRGVAKRGHIAVGGHSYGAHMSMSLLAHAGDLFSCAICRSGAYNRTLTPFGFQGETRSLWKARDVYFNLSPFRFADKIKKPVLLLHGDDDNNTGTFPLQSERMYAALKGHGCEVKLVQLPHEAHSYRARESVLHTLAEQAEWLERHVTPPPAGTEDDA